VAKFLFVSWEGLIADIAWQVAKEGHETRLWIQNPEEQGIGNGFVPKTNDWKNEVDWADVVVFDDVLGMGALAEELRARGKPSSRRPACRSSRRRTSPRSTRR
jgi:phosphoribosylamine---glycine ligase